jgi:hypothetical protein
VRKAPEEFFRQNNRTSRPAIMSLAIIGCNSLGSDELRRGVRVTQAQSSSVAHGLMPIGRAGRRLPHVAHRCLKISLLAPRCMQGTSRLPRRDAGRALVRVR